MEIYGDLWAFIQRSTAGVEINRVSFTPSFIHLFISSGGFLFNWFHEGEEGGILCEGGGIVLLRRLTRWILVGIPSSQDSISIPPLGS